MKRPAKIYTIIIFAIVIIFFGYSSCTSEKKQKESVVENFTKLNPNVVHLQIEQRKLWEDHISWTRNVIFCIVDELPGKEQAIERLLRNQIEIGHSFEPYYGKTNGENLTKLLTEHIHIAGEMIEAVKMGVPENIEKKNNHLYTNATEIAEFLCELNPAWNLKDMNRMMEMHITMTIDETLQRVYQNYHKDVLIYDQVHSEILKMADVFTFGINKQFPEKFLSKNN